MLLTDSAKLGMEEKLDNLHSAYEEAVEDFEANAGKGEVSKLDMFDITGLQCLYSKLLELEQWNDSFTGNYAFKKRLVKINKYADIVTKSQHPETFENAIIIRGLFLEVEVCLIPERFVGHGKARKGNHSVDVLIPPRNPEELGLPNSNEVLWGTIRYAGPGYYAVLSCRGSQDWFKEWIPCARNWDYVQVS